MFFIVRAFYLMLITAGLSHAENHSPKEYIKALGSTVIDTVNIGSVVAYKYMHKDTIKFIYENENGEIFSDDILLRSELRASTTRPSFINEGGGKKQLFVFTSPYCEACQSLWYSLRSKLEEYQVIWLPIHTDRNGNMIYEKIIDSSSPEKALENYVEYKIIPNVPSINRTTEFTNNLTKMNSLNLNGTPSGVIVTETGKTTFLGIQDLRSKGVIN
jgi:hypothetical protein